MPTPDLTAPLLAWVLLPVVVLLGFFLPGHLIFRALPGPLPWARAFVGSILALFGTVLLFTTAGIPITFPTLAAGLGLLSVGGWLAAGRPRLFAGNWPRPTLAWRDWWWLLPCLAAAASVLSRTLIEPLSGWDNIFRWNHLALLIRAQESLNAYPPVSAADFRVYPWCDGIPPALSLTNLWIYLGTGSTYGGLIFGRVLVEFALTYALVWHLAGQLWGATASRFAVAILATASLFMWSLANSQETGLTGVALLAMAACALHYRQSPHMGTAIWLMLAASLAALTRDYNLVFPPLACLILLLAKAPRTHQLAALAVGVVVVCPWYVRNAWLTGNPLYAESLGGLLPTNPYHGPFTRAVRDYWSLGGEADNRWHLLRNILQSGGLVLLLGGGALLRRESRRAALPLIAGAAALLWLASVSSTAGGWSYSLRVLGPALPLLAVAAGWWAGRLQPRLLVALGAALLPYSLHTARVSWTIPSLFNQPVWPYSWRTYDEITTLMTQLRYPQVWSALAGAADNEGIVVDHPMNVIFGGQAGGLMIFLTSPEAGLLLQPAATDFATVRRSLRARHIRFLVLSVDTPMHTRLLQGWPAIRAVRATRPAAEIGGMLIYDLALSPDEPLPRRRLITGP